MNIKTVGTAIGIVALLRSAAETLAEPSISTYALRRQAGRVMRACDNAIASAPSGMVIVNRDGAMQLRDSLRRSTDKIAKSFVRIAGNNLDRRQMYCPVFVAARVMACHYALNSMIYRHDMPRLWRMVEQTSYTMLKMLVVDLESEEAVMWKIAEAFEMEVAV